MSLIHNCWTMWPSNPSSHHALVGLRAGTFRGVEQEQTVYRGIQEPGPGTGKLRPDWAVSMKTEERRATSYIPEMVGIAKCPHSVFLGLAERRDVQTYTPPMMAQSHASVGQSRPAHVTSAPAVFLPQGHHLPAGQIRVPCVTNHVTGKQTYCRIGGTGSHHPHDACTSWSRGATHRPGIDTYQASYMEPEHHATLQGMTNRRDVGMHQVSRGLDAGRCYHDPIRRKNEEQYHPQGMMGINPPSYHQATIRAGRSIPGFWNRSPWVCTDLWRTPATGSRRNPPGMTGRMDVGTT